MHDVSGAVTLSRFVELRLLHTEFIAWPTFCPLVAPRADVVEFDVGGLFGALEELIENAIASSVHLCTQAAVFTRYDSYRCQA